MAWPPSWHCEYVCVLVVCVYACVLKEENECITRKSWCTRDGFGRWREWMRHEWRSQGVRETWHLIIQVLVCMCVCVWYVALEGRGVRDARCLMNWTETHKYCTATNPLPTIFVHILVFTICKCLWTVCMMFTAAQSGRIHVDFLPIETSSHLDTL